MLELVKTYKKKRYGDYNVTAASDMYVELGSKFCTRGKHLKMSIDNIQ